MLITVPRVLATAVASVTLAAINALSRVSEPNPPRIPIPAIHQDGPRVLPDPTRHQRSHP